MPANINHQNKWIIAGVAALIAGVATLYYFYEPVKGSIFPSCPFHALTGIFCPGCGSQRAIHQLLHGRFGAAAGYNLLAVIYLPLLALHFASVAGQAFGTRWRFTLFNNRYFTYATLGFVLLFWLLRNLPYEPFCTLAPAACR